MPSLISRLKYHIAAHDSPHRIIALGFIWIGLFVLLGKLAGVAKEMAIAWHYGISEMVDAYVFVFNLINLPVSLWFSILTAVLIPLLAQLRRQAPSELMRFWSELLGLTLVIGMGLGCVTYFIFPLLLNTGWFGLSGGALQEAHDMVGPLSLLLPLGVLIALFSVWLMSNGRHLNTLLESLPALAILGALLLPPGWIGEPLVWGTLAGFALQVAALAVPVHYSQGLSPPALTFRSPGWSMFWRSFGIMATGQAVMSLTGIIDQLFAAHLGAGAIATLSYASRIVGLILALGATSIGRAMLPVFSKLPVQAQTGGVEIYARHWAKLMFLVGAFAAAVIGALSPWIVELLFQRGAFTAKDTLAVTDLMRYLLLQVPFYFYGQVLVSVFASKRQYSILLVGAKIGLAVKLIGNFIFVQYLGLNGIALCTSLVYVATSTYLNLKLLKNE